MEPTFFPKPADFRQWLDKNHDSETELWVAYYKVKSGKASITWPESVDQALCYGWIDGLRKSVDEHSYKIRFTPRNPNSIWSARNIGRIEALKKEGLMMPAGLALYNKKIVKKSKTYAYEQKNVELDEVYLKALQSSPKAWAFFQSLPPSAKKPSIWYVMSAKQETTRLRRMDILIQSSEEGLRIPQLRRRKG